MKITNIKVLVTCPGRNYVLVKVETDEGLYGWGDATLNGREQAVVGALETHVASVLIGTIPAEVFMTKRKTKPKKNQGGGRGRFSAGRKAEAVRRLVAGEDLDTLARELGVTAATLASWRDKYHLAGEGALKSRPRDDRDEEILRLKAMVGELTMRNEILQEGIRIKEGRPFLTRRSRP